MLSVYSVTNIRRQMFSEGTQSQLGVGQGDPLPVICISYLAINTASSLENYTQVHLT